MTTNTANQAFIPSPENLASGSIGIFDSGVGGLSIAKCIRQHLPREQLIYVADSAYAPYGDKTTALITDRVNVIARRLIELKAKALVIACNTATVNAIDQLRSQISLPVIGVEPAIKPAALQSKTKKVAILVTSATASNSRFLSLVKRYSQGVDVFIQPCPGLVELIEQGKLNSPECGELLKEYVTPLKAQGIDTLVLGCTHYPFLQAKIQGIVGKHISIVETADAVTSELKRQLDKHQLYAPASESGHNRFFTTSLNRELNREHKQKQVQLFSNLWQEDIFLENLCL